MPDERIITVKGEMFHIDQIPVIVLMNEYGVRVGDILELVIHWDESPIQESRTSRYLRNSENSYMGISR